jgi:hypothetical protein
MSFRRGEGCTQITDVYSSYSRHALLGSLVVYTWEPPPPRLQVEAAEDLLAQDLALLEGPGPKRNS